MRLNIGMSYKVKYLLILCLCFLVGNVIYAKDMVEFKYLSPVEINIITENITYRFNQQFYVPEYKVSLINEKDASYKSPENTAISYLSAIASKNHIWAKVIPRYPSKREFNKKPNKPVSKEEKRIAEAYSEYAKNKFYDKIFYLTSKVTKGNQVIINIRTHEPKTGNYVEDTPLMIVFDAGVWKIGRKRSRKGFGPLFFYRNSTEDKIVTKERKIVFTHKPFMLTDKFKIPSAGVIK